MDNYYKPIEKQVKDENGIENFDLPESLDRERFHCDLKKLIEGETLEIKEYTFNHSDIMPRNLTIKSAPILVVEGLFTFYFEEINDLLNLRIYVDTPDYLMLKRRILRDANERGYDLNDVLYRYEEHVTPTFKKFVLPTKDDADLIIPNHQNFNTALEVIVGYVQRILEQPNT